MQSKIPSQGPTSKEESRTFDTSGLGKTTEDDLLSKMSMFSQEQKAPKFKSRVVYAPVQSNLTFQMIIYYNFYYAFLHAFFLLTVNVYKLYMFQVREYREFLTLFFILIYFPVELAILYFGYIGNIKESMSELIAFLTFTIFFKVPIQVGIFFQAFLFPLEYSCFWIIGGFIILELIFSIISIYNMKSVLFYQNAPLFDPKFAKLFRSRQVMKSSREIALGLKKYKGETEADDIYLRPLKKE